MKYELVAVINCNDERLQENPTVSPVNDYAKRLLSIGGCEPVVMNSLKPYDEIIDESCDYLLAYADCGMAEYVYLYVKLNGHPFNFNCNGGVFPTYRVEYSKKGGAPSVSYPAIFNDDEQAIVEAVNESHDWAKIGMKDIVVLKYEKTGLTEIWRNK